MPKVIKALSLWQPYARAIAVGLKTYETRSWSTPYRGELAIHAAKRWTKAERAIIDQLMRKHPVLVQFWSQQFPLGAMLCTCQLVAIHPVEAVRDEIPQLEHDLGNYADGRFAWELNDIVYLEKSIPTIGRQGLWNWEKPQS